MATAFKVAAMGSGMIAGCELELRCELNAAVCYSAVASSMAH